MFVLPSDGFKLDIAVKAPQPKSKSPAATAAGPQFTFSSPIQKISSPLTASPGSPAVSSHLLFFSGIFA
jgi:hypothetical protein